MSWGRLSLLTKLTRPPTAIVTDRGDTPADVMVIVGVEPPGVGVGVGVGVGLGLGAGDGELGESLSPPQDTAVAMIKAANRGARNFRIRKTSLRY
jgi:hypothetical protein